MIDIREHGGIYGGNNLRITSDYGKFLKGIEFDGEDEKNKRMFLKAEKYTHDQFFGGSDTVIFSGGGVIATNGGRVYLKVGSEYEEIDVPQALKDRMKMRDFEITSDGRVFHEGKFNKYDNIHVLDKERGVIQEVDSRDHPHTFSKLDSVYSQYGHLITDRGGGPVFLVDGDKVVKGNAQVNFATFYGEGKVAAVYKGSRDAVAKFYNLEYRVGHLDVMKTTNIENTTFRSSPTSYWNLNGEHYLNIALNEESNVLPEGVKIKGKTPLIGNVMYPVKVGEYNDSVRFNTVAFLLVDDKGNYSIENPFIQPANFEKQTGETRITSDTRFLGLFAGNSPVGIMRFTTASTTTGDGVGVAFYYNEEREGFSVLGPLRLKMTSTTGNAWNNLRRLTEGIEDSMLEGGSTSDVAVYKIVATDKYLDDFDGSNTVMLKTTDVKRKGITDYVDGFL